MAYNKEYYEANKDKFKAIRDRYRHNPENREKINEQRRNKYKNLSDSEKKQIVEQNRLNRAKNGDKTRIRYRISQKKRQLKEYLAKYEELSQDLFDLNLIDSWGSDEYAYSNELCTKMHLVKQKIDKKNEEIAKLEKEKELM